MKLLKLSILAVLMTFAMMSCKDDTTSPNDDDEEFTIITEEQPLNIIIKTYNDDVLIDSVRIYEEIGEMLPDGIYYWSEHLTNQKTLNLRFYQYPNPTFDLSFEFKSEKFKKGSFSLYRGSSTPLNYYVNPLLTSQYEANVANLIIEDIKHFENTESEYFISGEISANYKKIENETHVTRVKVLFENMHIYLKTYDD